jgi:hypothetical protein
MNQDTITIDELVRQAEAIIQDCFASSGRNWLRYQTAREEFWRTRGSKGTLAEQIDKYVQSLHERAPHEAARYLTHFLGFMRRTLIALRYLDQIPTEFKGATR